MAEIFLFIEKERLSYKKSNETKVLMFIFYIFVCYYNLFYDLFRIHEF